MSGLVNYLSSWWESPDNQEGTNVDKPVPNPVPNPPPIKNNIKLRDTVLLITANDLLLVKLKPVHNVIPAPARNMPLIDKFQLEMLKDRKSVV